MKSRPFDADFIHPDNWEEAQVVIAIHRPTIVRAIQLNFPEGFQVHTKQGLVQGKPGDYLIFLPDGEKFPCNRDTFDRVYRRVETEDVEPHKAWHHEETREGDGKKWTP